MVRNLSILVAWHDSGWNGRICRHPKENAYCETFKWLKTVKYGYNPEKRSIVDKCEDKPNVKVEELKEGSACSEINLFHTGEFLGIFYGIDSENKRDEIFELLKLAKGGLALIYVRENPISDSRIITACIRIKDIKDEVWNQRKKNIGFQIINDLENVVFIIPYQELLEYYKNKGEKYSDDLILDVGEFERYFKGMVNFISTPISISILKKALKIIEEINKLRKEDPKLDEFLRQFRPGVTKIDELPNRIVETIAELKREEFKFPGLPALLFYLGTNNAYTLYLELWEQKREEGEEELFRTLMECLSNKTEKPEYGITRRVLNKFDAIEEKLANFLLKYGVYYDLTSVKIQEIRNQMEKGFIDGNELISNPYSISENMKEKEGIEATRFEEIDYWERKRLGKDFDPYNPYRIRALLVAILKRALELGHTSLSIADLKNYFERLDTNINFDEFLRLIERNENLIKDKVNISKEIIEGESFKIFTLKEVRELERVIEDTVSFLTEIERPQLNIKEEEIKTVLKSRIPDGISKEEYEKVLKEQIDAVRGLLEYRVGILTGPAGSGKTHLIKALVTLMKEKEGLSNILVLTPTGKSAVRIREVLQNLVEPKTIHRFIAQEMREYFDFEYFLLKDIPEFEKKNVNALIIDEASMVDTLLLGKLLSVINKDHLKRLILVGDINQLPPVEAGKPFYDLYQYLERSDVGFIAKLNIVLRASSRRIVEFSRIFLSDTPREDKEHIIKELFGNRQIHDGEERYSIKDRTKEVVTIRVVKDVKRALEEAIEELLKENGLTIDDFFKFMILRIDCRF